MIEERSRADPLVWWMMITFAGMIIVGGGAWCSQITAKVERIAPMEANIAYIQNDVKSIKDMIAEALKKPIT